MCTQYVLEIYCVLYVLEQGCVHCVLEYYTCIRSSERAASLLLALAEGLGALWTPRALLGAFSPLLSSSIQKYTLRQLCNNFLSSIFGHQGGIGATYK